MKYLNNTPFSSQPATENYRNNYPFRDKFAEALAAEKKAQQCRRVAWRCNCGTWNESMATSGAFDETCWRCRCARQQTTVVVEKT
jgi:hypothetical protein